MHDTGILSFDTYPLNERIALACTIRGFYLSTISICLMLWHFDIVDANPHRDCGICSKMVMELSASISILSISSNTTSLSAFSIWIYNSETPLSIRRTGRLAPAVCQIYSGFFLFGLQFFLFQIRTRTVYLTYSSLEIKSSI